jgi:hypothetical protein
MQLYCFTPIKTHFYYDLVDECYSPKDAVVKAHAAITAHHATGPNGYNTLAGHPPSCAKHWKLKRLGII